MREHRGRDTKVVYEFKVRGHLGEQWCDWFGDLQMAYEEDETVLWGAVPDQAALYGIIARLGNLGLTLVSVNRRAAEAAPVQSESSENV